jgi:RNA polymerase subunit RPABC4/transcription elongation factor Spt4
LETIAARGVQVLLALGGAYLLALWFVLVVWTFRDIETRSKSVVTQVVSTLLVVLFYVPGVLLYLILRPKETLDASFQRSLEEEYLLQDLEELPLCRTCQHYVEEDFMLCPHCQTQLRDACVACARLVDLRWAVCPYCGTEQNRKPAEESQVAEIGERWVSPAVVRRRLLKRGAGSSALPEMTPAAARMMDSSELPPAPVRLFDRRKTRESAKISSNGRTNGNGNGHSESGSGNGVAVASNGTNGHSAGSSNGHAENGSSRALSVIADDKKS